MALRAGYFGLKRFEKNKLSILAASTPADISPDNPIAGKNDVLASIDLFNDTTGWLSYNLLNNILSSGSSHQIDYTVNADKSVSVSGQADADVYLTVINAKTFPAGSYHFEGCPSGGSTGKYSFFIRPSNTTLPVYGEDIGSGIDFTISEPTELVAFIKIKNGFPTNGETLLFKPMLCKLIYKDMPYEPYHESVEEMLTPKLLTSANDLDNIKTSGDYYWTQSYPAHSPENNTFGGLRVIPCGEVVHQMVIRGAASSASIYIRRFQETWSNWFKFSGTEVTPASFTKEEETKKTTKKKVIKEEEE